jgi:hypothetical protein
MRILFALSFVLFFVTSSIGQSFSLPELIKMSRMDTDNFDTYVSSKGFTYLKNKTDNRIVGVTYGLNSNQDGNGRADKYISLFTEYYDYKYAITYQSSLQSSFKKEYFNIKNQIKSMGFKLVDTGTTTGDNDLKFSRFVYRKGKAEVDLFTSLSGFEISYTVDY